MKLSEREIAVLRLLSTGLQQKQVADRLGVTTATVQSHMRNATQRNKARNTLALAVAAVRAGVI